MSKSYSYNYPLPAVTTDIVIFTIREECLSLLLIKRGATPFKGSWALPGGVVGIDEGLDECASRELKEETGVKDIYLEQLYSWGKPDRDPRERVISVSYFALVPLEHMALQAATDAVAVAWFPLRALPKLAFDHADIVSVAYARLKAKLGYSTIALQLLPSKFSLTRLQSVYEIILGEPVDKRNFRKRLHALGWLVDTGEIDRSGKHRPAKLYSACDPDNVTYFK